MKLALAFALALLLVPGAGAQEPVKLDFAAGDVKEVLKLYGTLAKKRIIWDSTIQGQLRLVTEDAVPPSQAILLIEQSLLLNGFCLVNRDLDTVAVLGLAKNPRQYGVPIISRTEDIPNQEKVITYVFRLKHRDAREVQQLLQQYVPAQTFSSFIADPRAKLLLVTESISMIRRLQDFMREIDVPVAPDKSMPEEKPGAPEKPEPTNKPVAPPKR